MGIHTTSLLLEALNTEHNALHVLVAGGIYQFILLKSADDMLGNLNAACRMLHNRDCVQTPAIWTLSEYTVKNLYL